MSDDFEIAREKIWYDTDELSGLENFIGEYLVFDLGKDNHNLDSYFVVGHVNEPPNPDEPDIFHTKIMFFRTGEDIEDHKPKFSLDISNFNFYTAKEIVENTAKHFNSIDMYSFYDMKEYTLQQIPPHHRIIDEQGLTSYNNENTIQEDMVSRPPLTQIKHFEQSTIQNNELETANKTGYVQGVCESVLAFNTDENRKIMSEDTMSFLSKKILSEMHVTKDMAQKFANPDTYKALEQYVFTPKQEQQLEQAQSQGIGR